MFVMNINKTFINYYILHPLEHPSKRKRLLYLVGSAALAVFCLGHFHRKAKSLAERKIVPGEVKQPIPPETLAPLTPQAIAKMTPDEQGDLIEKMGIAEKNPVLSQEQLKAMLLNPEKADHQPVIISEQQARSDLCGLYAINNALQKETMSPEDFIKDVEKQMTDLFGEGVLIPGDRPDADGPQILSILENKLNIACDLVPLEPVVQGRSKQQALTELLEGKEWAIVYHHAHERIEDKERPISYRFPSTGNAVRTFSCGHFAAIRKDANNNWWYVDSRFPSPSCIPLALIPQQCVLIIPQNT